MTPPDPLIQIDRRAREILENQYHRVVSPMSGQRVWERLLSSDDRRRLGDSFLHAYNRYQTIGMWVKLRGVPADHALVELSYRLNFIDLHTRDWLLRELGEPVPAAA